jgi:hypothetical protein
MPKKQMDYSKCIIYKIVCNDLSVSDCYVGHTTNFKQRKNHHRADCNFEGSRSYTYKLYQTMREKGGRDNWSMIEIEKYPCQDFNEATARERYWYETLKANLNGNVPNRKKEEYKKEYNETNKEQLSQQKKEWYETNKEEIIQKQKEYYETNKEVILQKQKEYYEKNKEELTKTINCECGGTYRIPNKSRHYKTKKHQTFDLMNITQNSVEFDSSA